jgi:hypothetical protein
LLREGASQGRQAFNRGFGFRPTSALKLLPWLRRNVVTLLIRPQRSAGRASVFPSKAQAERNARQRKGRERNSLTCKHLAAATRLSRGFRPGIRTACMKDGMQDFHTLTGNGYSTSVSPRQRSPCYGIIEGLSERLGRKRRPAGVRLQSWKK